MLTKFGRLGGGLGESGATAVTPPAYVNVGSQTSTGAGTSLALSLPGSRVNGNLLIAFIYVLNPSSATVTWPGDWTPIDNVGGSSGPAGSIAYCYVTGSEAGPTVTWTGSGSARGAIAQFSTTRGSSPIGAVSKNAQGVTATITCAAITSTATQSLAFGLVNANTGTIAAPATWNPRFQLTTSARQTGFDKELGGSGNSSGAISITATVSNAASFNVEILAA
jgi:hypothetical protein